VILLVDAGNTRIKWAELAGAALRAGDAVEWRRAGAAIAFAAAWRALEPPERIIACSVAGREFNRTLDDWCEDTWRHRPEFVAVERHALGVTNAYEDVAQMGVDRWVAMLAAWHHRRSAVCVVNCGTAITVDVIAAGGRHLGGLIAPGLALMRSSLASRTAQLPEVGPAARLAFGTDTASCIGAGCLAAGIGLLEVVEARARELLNTSPAWVISGGDAETLASESAIAFEHLPDLVLRGLGLIAESGS
jgi:type III pantothenate kinase